MESIRGLVVKRMLWKGLLPEISMDRFQKMVKVVGIILWNRGPAIKRLTALARNMLMSLRVQRLKVGLLWLRMRNQRGSLMSTKSRDLNIRYFFDKNWLKNFRRLRISRNWLINSIRMYRNTVQQKRCESWRIYSWIVIHFWWGLWLRCSTRIYITSSSNLYHRVSHFLTCATIQWWY